LIERPHHNILYAVGKSKLANVVLLPCKLLGDQVRFARDRRSIGRQGRYLDRSDLAESGRMSGRAFSNGRCGDAAGIVRTNQAYRGVSIIGTEMYGKL
jgi:hypothetical protein